MDRRAVGTAAESVAREHLCAHGLTLVCENYRCRLGELDLVLIESDVLVIVEVRLRASTRFGSASESIDWIKRRRILRATEHLRLRHRELRHLRVRFDVVAFDAAAPGDGGVQWIRGAFDAGDR
jgi:putative endonuclease